MKRLSQLFVALCLLVFAACNDKNNPILPPPPPVILPPTVTGVTPDHASKGEPFLAKINGTDFTNATRVTMGDGVSILGFTVKSATLIEVNCRVNLTAESGKKNVTVTTAAGTGTGNKLFQVINNRVPIAKIIVSPDRGAANSVYQFDGLGSDDPDGAVINYAWNFGDNRRANGSVVNHKYGVAGTFTITLTVTDNDEASDTTEFEIKVLKGEAPDAKFTFSPKAGDINTTFTFDASSSIDDGRIREYFWNFGAGKTATGAIVQHKFNQGGIFNVELTITDNQGFQTTAGKQVTIGEFDQERATTQIRNAIENFFRLYSRLTELSAEQIVVNFSEDGSCRGRAHEINIIQQQQQTTLSNRATITGEIAVTFNSSTRAHAVTPGHFEWTDAQGSHSGDGTHDFSMIFEDDDWYICDFVVYSGEAAIMQMFQ